MTRPSPATTTVWNDRRAVVEVGRDILYRLPLISGECCIVFALLCFRSVLMHFTASPIQSSHLGSANTTGCRVLVRRVEHHKQRRASTCAAYPIYDVDIRCTHKPSIYSVAPENDFLAALPIPSCPDIYRQGEADTPAHRTAGLLSDNIDEIETTFVNPPHTAAVPSHASMIPI